MLTTITFLISQFNFYFWFLCLHFLGGSRVASGDGVIGGGESAVSTVGGVIEGDGVASDNVVRVGGVACC